VWHRLGRDDFAKTNALRMDSRGDSRIWGVCREYEVREATEGGRGTTFVVPRFSSGPGNEDKWTWYRPLEDYPDLILRFAKLYERGDDSVEIVLDWVRRFGVLGHGSGWHSSAPQSVEGFREAVEDAAGVLTMYEAVLNSDEEKAKALYLEEFPFVGPAGRLRRQLKEIGVPVDTWDDAADVSEVVEKHYDGDYLAYVLDVAVDAVNDMVRHFCYPNLDMGYGLHRRPSDVRTSWGFESLVGAMYLQLYWLIGSGGEVTRCKYCGRIISLARPHPGARKVRQDKSFCDDACRQRHHYHNKTKLGRRGNHR
jgi:hypothetical protein